MRAPADKIERLLAGENWLGARRVVLKELARAPKDHWLLSRLALTYYEQGRYKEALKHEARALALAPRCPLVLWGLAGTHHMLGRLDAAVVLYQRLIRRGAPRIAAGRCGEGIRRARGLVADCWFRLGEIREDRGQRRLAERAYREHVARRVGAASIYEAALVREKLRALRLAKHQVRAE